MKWTSEMTARLKELYTSHTNREIATITGWAYKNIMNKGKNIGLKKAAGTKSRAAGSTPWTKQKITYLTDHFFVKTNQQLANDLGFKITVVRNKASELGLKRIDMEYWSKEQIEFLQANFRTMGDMDIVHHFTKHWPKNKKWTRSHISKKRKQMNLHRTPEEVALLVTKNVSPGGASFTIIRNSASTRLPDNYVAMFLAWRDPEKRREVLKYPDLIDLKRKQIQLNRTIKEVKNGR